MTGKTFTNQDVVLGVVLLQQMPLGAILPKDKQHLIDNKQLTAGLLRAVFTQLSEITEVVRSDMEIRIWSSETMEADPYVNDDEIDAAELWVRLRFIGLTPSLSFVLQEVAGVYIKQQYVVNEWKKEIYSFDDFVDPSKISVEVSAASIFSGIWCFSDLFAQLYCQYLDVIRKHLVVTGFARAQRDEETGDVDHVVYIGSETFYFNIQ